MSKGMGPARKEIAAARSAIERMKKATSFAAFEGGWQDCLTRIEKCWNKTKDAFADGDYGPWRGNHDSVRKSDPLLRYVSHARDAEEHTLTDTLAQEPASIGINPASGTSLYIQELRVIGGVMSIKSPQPVKVTIQPGRLRLLSATSRGVTYAPPSEHLGRPLESSEPLYVANRAIDYYERLLGEADRRFSARGGSKV